MRAAGWPLAARLARREVLRRPGRTLLVALLVAVPVAATMVAAVDARTGRISDDQAWRASYGTADVVLEPGSFAVDTARPAGGPPAVTEADLPPGSRLVTYHHRDIGTVRTVERRRSRPQITDLPLTDPMTAGVFRVTRGRAPAAPGEVLLSRVTAKDLGVRPGDGLRLERPVRTELHVVGIGERTAWYGAEFIAVLPGSPLLAATVPGSGPGPRPGSPGDLTVGSWVDLPGTLGPAQLAAWVGTLGGQNPQLSPAVEARFDRARALAATSPGSAVPAGIGYSSIRGDDHGVASGVRWAWLLGAVAFTVVGIVIASAFASSARRQLTTLGQLSANGAGPGVLRRVLFLQGTWTGVAGSLLGVALAAAGLAAAAPHRESFHSRDTGPWVVLASDLWPVLAIGIAAATIAALVPARTAVRVPVLSALAGRRPLARVPRWLPAAGLVTVAAGLGLLGLAFLGASSEYRSSSTVWALTGIAGGVAVLLGACAVTPALVALLEPLAGRIPGAWRLAVRSLARQRTRTSGVVSAVAATAALAIVGSAAVLGADAHASARAPYQAADEIMVQARLREPFDSATGRAGRVSPLTPPAGAVQRVVGALPGAEAIGLTLAAPKDDLAFGPRDFVPSQPKSGGWFGLWGSSSGDGIAVVADDAAARVYRLTQGERNTLAAQGALAFGETPGTGTLRLVPSGGVPGPGLATYSSSGRSAPAEAPLRPRPAAPPAPANASIELPGVTVADARTRSLGNLPRVLVTPETAARLGMDTTAGDVVVRTPAPLTREQRTLVADLVADIRDEENPGAFDPSAAIPVTDFSVPSGGNGPSPLLVDGVLAGIALLLTLFVVAASLALAATETRDERDVLAVVGASPSVMRRVSARKALLQSGLGAALAVPVGFLPVVVFTRADPGRINLVFPWRIVVLLAVAVPLVAYAVTSLASGLALRLRPVRVSTMALD